MKGILPVLVTATLLVTACGPGGQTNEPSPTETPSAAPVVSTNAAPALTEQATCELLLGAKEDGPLFEAAKVMNEVLKDRDDEIVGKPLVRLDAVRGELYEIAVSSEPGMNELIGKLNEPFLSILAAYGDSSNVKLEPFKEAGTELVTRCTALTAAPTATPTPTPTPTRTKTPTPTPTAESAPTGEPARVVKYVIESDGSIESITYSNTVDGSSGQEQATGPMSGKVEKTYTFPGHMFGGRYDFNIFGVGAMAGADASTISCKIIINGDIIKEQTSTGAYAHVSCYT